MRMPTVDLTGRVFGRLRVIRFDGRGERRQARWLCACECGREVGVLGARLTQPTRPTISCGCVWKSRGGRSRTPEYGAWLHMIGRCHNTDDPGYKSYGGLGVIVCRRWRHSFDAFLADVGPRPPGTNGKRAAYSLDRFPDKNGNYEPGNVRWATWREQQNNRRNNRRLTLGAETHTLAEWARRLGVSGPAVSQRLRMGWSMADALTSPACNNSADRGT